MMYEVGTHYYGRRLITRDGPAQGLLEWPAHVWTTITARPIGLVCARVLADAQPTHDNGRPALVPDGWYPPTAQTADRNINRSIHALKKGGYLTIDDDGLILLTEQGRA